MAVPIQTTDMKTGLRECYLVHVLKQFILLDELILESPHLGRNLSILRLKSVHLHLCLHVLLVEILARLQCPLRDDLRSRKLPTKS